jgi:hypothetical protein
MRSTLKRQLRERTALAAARSALETIQLEWTHYAQTGEWPARDQVQKHAFSFQPARASAHARSSTKACFFLLVAPSWQNRSNTFAYT